MIGSKEVLNSQDRRYAEKKGYPEKEFNSIAGDLKALGVGLKQVHEGRFKSSTSKVSDIHYYSVNRTPGSSDFTDFRVVRLSPKAPNLDKKIVRLLSRNGELDPSEIAGRLGVSRRSVGSRLNAMTVQGIVYPWTKPEYRG